jgi:hypothetical protein
MKKCFVLMYIYIDTIHGMSNENTTSSLPIVTDGHTLSFYVSMFLQYISEVGWFMYIKIHDHQSIRWPIQLGI